MPFIGRIYLVVILSYYMPLSGQMMPVVDFLKSTIHVGQYNDYGQKINFVADNLQNYQEFKALYEEYIVNNLEYAEQARIPKIIHHIWLGSPLPERCNYFIETWRKHHPEWTLVLWDDARVAQLGLVNQHFYDAASNYGEKSDIARYEILYRFGGLYVDTDFECLQSFDTLHHCCDLYVGSYPCVGQGICLTFNGLLAAAPGHPVLKRCIYTMQRPTDASNYSTDIMDRTGPSHFTRCLKTSMQREDVIGRCVPFPPTYFYSWPGVCRGNKNRQFIESFLCPESLAVHHWATSWLS